MRRLHPPHHPPRLAGFVPGLLGLSLIPITVLRADDYVPLAADRATLRAQQQVFRDVAAAVRPGLVRIETVGGSQPVERIDEDPDADAAPDAPRAPRRTQNPFRDNPGSDFTLADGATTGIIYAPDGYILTSSFNFVRDPVLISVTLADGRRLAADLVARDQVRKIALLKIDAHDLPAPRWKPRSQIRVGDWAVALGLGFGGDEPSLTVGIISALNRMSGYALQTDAKLNPANYGGPLCDIEGRIVGLCVPMAHRPGELAGVELYDAGVGFVVPLDRIQPIVDVLRTGQSFYRGWLGMVAHPAAQDAVVVQKVADPSPTRSAGLVPGDRITAVNDRRILHFGHLIQAMNMIPAGETVELQVENADTAFSAAVTLARNTDLGSLPDAEVPYDPTLPPALPDMPAEE